MKNIQIFCVLAFIAAVTCVPVDRKTGLDGTDYVVVPLEGRPDFFNIDDGVVDTGYPGSFFNNFGSPFSNPFNGFWQSMEDTMRRLRQQMTQVLSRLPDNQDSVWTNLDGKGNTTSTTKIINGHKVTVNETTYVNEGDDNSGSFFKIHIVDVRPTSEESKDSSEETVVKTQAPAKDVEKITEKNEYKGSPETFDESANEIPRFKPENENQLDSSAETYGEDFSYDVFPDETMQNEVLSSPHFLEAEDNNLAPPVREIETNDVNIFEPIDLSNDISINKMLADAGAPMNPEAEIFSADSLTNGLPDQHLRDSDVATDFRK